MPEVTATAKNVGASTKRLRPIVDQVRGRTVNEALDTLGLLSSPWGAGGGEGREVCRRERRKQPVDESG